MTGTSTFRVDFRCRQYGLGSPSQSRRRGHTHAGRGQGHQTDGVCVLRFHYHTAPHSWPHPSKALQAPLLTPPTECRWHHTVSAHPDILEVRRTILMQTLQWPTPVRSEEPDFVLPRQQKKKFSWFSGKIEKLKWDKCVHLFKLTTLHYIFILCIFIFFFAFITDHGNNHISSVDPPNKTVNWTRKETASQLS